jgi:formate dehydrogenase maturation protein FdhE
MMKEAQKMMDNPEFQKQMKKLTGDKEFKDSLKKSADAMKDPAKAAELEARMEHMMKVGEQELKKAAGSVMDDAIAAMGNPQVMAEMTKMIKDPAFQEQLAAMAKDPNFKLYMESVSEAASFIPPPHFRTGLSGKTIS